MFTQNEIRCQVHVRIEERKERIDAEGAENAEFAEKRRTGLNRLRKKSLSSLKSAVMLSLSALSQGDF
jgi:hypothetical protein